MQQCAIEGRYLQLNVYILETCMYWNQRSYVLETCMSTYEWQKQRSVLKCQKRVCVGNEEVIYLCWKRRSYVQQTKELCIGNEEVVCVSKEVKSISVCHVCLQCLRSRRSELSSLSISTDKPSYSRESFFCCSEEMCD